MMIQMMIMMTSTGIGRILPGIAIMSGHVLASCLDDDHDDHDDHDDKYDVLDDCDNDNINYSDFCLWG